MDKMAETIRAAAIVKLAQLGSSFLAGINPLGTSTVELGRGTKERDYAPMQTAGVLGGLVGGGVLLPGAVSGAMNVAQNMRSASGALRSPTIKTFWEGAKRPFVNMYEGVKGYGLLSDYANKGITPTPAQQRQLSNLIMKNTSLESAAKAFRGMTPLKKLRTAVTAGVGAFTGKPQISRSLATTAMPVIKKGLIGAGFGIGLPAAVTALAAYTQYRLGQKLRRKQQREMQQNTQAELARLQRARGYGGA